MEKQKYIVTVTSVDGKQRDFVWTPTLHQSYLPWIDRIIDYVETGVWKGREKAGPVDEYRSIYAQRGRGTSRTYGKNVAWGSLCESISQFLSQECANDEEYRKSIIKEANSIVRLQNNRIKDDFLSVVEQYHAFEEDEKCLNSTKRYLSKAVKENDRFAIAMECYVIIRNFGLFTVNSIKPLSNIEP